MQLWYCGNKICRFATFSTVTVSGKINFSRRKFITSLEKPSIHLKNENLSQSSELLSFILLKTVATLRNRRKLAAVSRDTQENTRKSQTQDTFTPGVTKEYITHVSEESEGRVNKKLSQEFIGTESHIVGALSKLDEFLLNPQVQICSVAVQGTSPNNDSENREPTGDRSLNDPYPEVDFPACRTSNLSESDPEKTFHTNIHDNSIVCVA